MICSSLSFKYQNSIPVAKESINMVARNGHHDLHYYENIAIYTSVTAMLAFLFMFTFGVSLYYCLSPYMKKIPSEEDDEEDVTYEERESIKRCRCYTKKCLEMLAELMLRLTIATSQFLYGSNSVKLKDKISYRYRCIKIGNRYFRLSFLALFPFVVCNTSTIACLALMAISFSMIRVTYVCNENIDCFLANGSNNTRITDCSMYEGIEVVCYTYGFQESFVLGLIGGVIKIVPPISFQLATTFHLVLLKNCHGRLKFLAFFGVYIVAILLLTIIYIVSLEFSESEGQMYQIIAAMIIFQGIFLFPWCILDLDFGRYLDFLKRLHQRSDSDNEHKPIIPRDDDINDPSKDIVIKQADLKHVNDNTIQRRPISHGATNM